MRERRTESVIIAICCVALLIYGVWRATLGVTFADDGYYVSAALRFSQGARIFTDELFVQSLASALTGPIAWVWQRLAGVSYLALVLRLTYLASAAGTAWAVYRVLRARVGALAAATAVVAVVCAPPFNILSLSYNSLGLLALLGAFACAVRAAGLAHPVGDADVGPAAGERAIQGPAAGVRAIGGPAAGAAALGVVAAFAYPPLGAAAIVLLGVLVVRVRTRGVVLGGLAGGLGALAVITAWLAVTTTVTDVLATFEFAAAQRILGTTYAEQAAALGRLTRVTLTVRDLWPMWAAAFVAVVAPSRRARAIAVAAVPLLAAVPGVRAVTAGGDAHAFGVVGAAYLLIVGAGLLVPVVAHALRLRDAAAVDLVLLGVLTGVVGFIAVGTFTQAGWYWGMPIVGAAPLVAATLAVWGAWVRHDLGTVAASAVSAVLIGVLVIALTLTPFKAPRPTELTRTVRSGAYAGLRVEPGRYDAIVALQRAGRRWVSADDRVLVLNGPGVYPLVGGRIETPAIWLGAGTASTETVAYFDRRDSWPDLVFVTPDPAELPDDDALLGRIAAEYERVDEAAGFVVFARR